MSEIRQPYQFNSDIQLRDNGRPTANAEGIIRYNSNTKTFEGFANGKWHDIGRMAKASFTPTGTGQVWVKVPFVADDSKGLLPLKFTITKADAIDFVDGVTVLGGPMLDFTGTPVDSTTGLSNSIIVYSERGKKNNSFTQWITNAISVNENGVCSIYLLMQAGYAYDITFDTEYGATRSTDGLTYFYAPTVFLAANTYQTNQSNAIHYGVNSFSVGGAAGIASTDYVDDTSLVNALIFS